MNTTKQILDKIDNIIKNKKSNQEFEIRFGKFENQFTPGITEGAYNRLIKFLDSFIDKKDTEYSFIMNYKSNIRVKQILEKSKNSLDLSFPDTEKVLNTEFITKEKIETIDLHEDNIRFSLSEENPVISEEEYNSLVVGGPVYYKSRKRYIYKYNDFSIELSSFVDGGEYNGLFSTPKRYEIELELNSNTEYHSFLVEILKAINDSGKLLDNGTLIDNDETNDIMNSYIRLVGKNTFIGNQPETIRYSKINLNLEYALTVKLDGRRLLLFIRHGRIYSLNSKMIVENTNIEVDNAFDGCILDSEFYDGKYYVFDIYFLSGTDLRERQLDLRHRIDMINRILINIANNAIVTKEYHFGEIYKTSMELLKKLFVNIPHGIDGLIYTPVDYNNKNPTLKWKPQNMNTIDFKIIKTNCTDDYEEWELCVYNKNGDIKFTVPHYDDNVVSSTKVPTIDAKNYSSGSIVEFYFDYNKFIPVKPRPDKTRGNHISVALDNFESIIKPFDFEVLNGSVERSSFFFNEMRFNEYVKLNVINKYCNKSRRLLDIYSGKSDNMSKWSANNIKASYGYDNDFNNTKLANENLDKFRSNPITKNFEYSFHCHDLLNKVIHLHEKVDNVTCLNNVHRFFENNSTLNTFIETISNNLQIGGHVMMIFKSKNIDFNSDKLKIKIKNNKLKIQKEDKIMEENIIDSEIFIKKMNSSGFNLVESTNFSEYYDSWQYNNNMMCNIEKVFSFLNNVLVFKKVSDINVVMEESGRKIYTEVELLSMKVDELKIMCNDLYLSKSGKKQDIIKRIMELPKTKEWHTYI